MRNIVRDLIVTISGDGWQFKAARLLVDSDGHAAVFTVRGDPDKTFDVADVSRIASMNGRFLTTEGETVVYRRRGASCAWKLAKCNVKTPALVALWDGAAAPEPVTVVSSGTAPITSTSASTSASTSVMTHTTEESQPDPDEEQTSPDPVPPPSDPVVPPADFDSDSDLL